MPRANDIPKHDIHTYIYIYICNSSLRCNISCLTLRHSGNNSVLCTSVSCTNIIVYFCTIVYCVLSVLCSSVLCTSVSRTSIIVYFCTIVYCVLSVLCSSVLCTSVSRTSIIVYFCTIVYCVLVHCALLQGKPIEVDGSLSHYVLHFCCWRGQYRDSV